MARLNIDTGTEGNVATGDTLRTAMTKINNNFIDVYGLVGDPSTGLLTNSTTNGDIKVQPNGTGIVEIDQLQITDAAITPLITNSDLTLTANGTGAVVVENLNFNDNTITSPSNSDISIQPGGTGNLVLGNITIEMNAVGTQIVSNDSTEIVFGEAVSVNGVVSANGGLAVTGAVVKMANLPTSDPSSAGQLWNSSGDLKVSAG